MLVQPEKTASTVLSNSIDRNFVFIGDSFLLLFRILIWFMKMVVEIMKLLLTVSPCCLTYML